MRSKLYATLFLILPLFSLAAEAGMETIDKKINAVFEPIVNFFSVIIFFEPLAFLGFEMPFIVLWLIVGAVFFTVKFNFINFTGVRHSIELIRGKYDDPNEPGEVSHFQALVTALSGTVGLGNIAGVAVAISLGGAGATFWMILAGIIGMSSKFVECTLGVKYRKINEKGEVSGGPMYYLSEGLSRKGFKNTGKVLAVVFSVLCVGGSFGGGNMFQANQSFAQVVNVFPVFEGKGFWYGIIIAIFVGAVIIGGIKKIASVTDKIVPFMVVIYVLSCLTIIGAEIGNIGSAFAQIWNGAFSPVGVAGGFMGVLIMGFRRAAFSNEAGIGSSAIAHSAVKTDEPISEGFVSLLEPFIDTVVICTMTALVLIFTGYAQDSSGLEGSALTSRAFSSVLPWFKYVLLVAIVLFAFSTMISWSYYGMKAWTYLFGNNKFMENAYKVLFLVFTVIGASSSLGVVMDFSDMMVLAMAVPNIIGLYFLSGEVRKDLADYLRRLKSGEITKFK